MSKCWQESDENISKIHRASVGDVVTFTDGRKYLIEKKTTTACAIKRYWWWNALYDRYFRKDKISA